MTADVRALTVRQPWAWAIAWGGKTIENRSRGTRFRGRLLIHAGKGWSDRGALDPRVVAAWQDHFPPRLRLPGVLEAHRVARGAIVAVAELVDVHPDADCCRPWGESSYLPVGARSEVLVHHLVLEDVRPLAVPVPCPGMLGLWRPPADVVAEVLR